MSDVLKITKRPPTVELELHRPECRNALSRELIAGLTQAVSDAGEDPTVRAVLITGTSPAFCSGLDLREVGDADGVAYDTSTLLGLYETIEQVRVPVIAAVNGSAMAGGAGIVTACDLAIFAESATIGYPGIRHGLVAPIVMVYLRRLVGERDARRLLLTGETIDAEYARRIGLCNAVVRDDRLLERARHEAGLLAASPADAVAETKAILNRMRRHSDGAAADELRRLSAEVGLSDDSRENLSRFLGR